MNNGEINPEEERKTRSFAYSRFGFYNDTTCHMVNGKQKGL